MNTYYLSDYVWLFQFHDIIIKLPDFENKCVIFRNKDIIRNSLYLLKFEVRVSVINAKFPTIKCKNRISFNFRDNWNAAKHCKCHYFVSFLDCFNYICFQKNWIFCWNVCLCLPSHPNYIFRAGNNPKVSSIESYSMV